MNKDKILIELKKASGNKNVKLPRDIKVSVNNNLLTLFLKEDKIIKNLQEDNSSFEAWAIILKRWIHEIENVEIVWETPKLNNTENNKEQQHYRRFLYRIKNFEKSYSWVYIADRNSIENKIFEKTNLILNIPSARKKNILEKNLNLKRKEIDDYSESQLEKLIMSDEKILKNFYEIFKIKEPENQLPVGVFDGQLKKENKFFTGGKSAIDIWGFNKENEFCLFELKKYNNKKVGVISEMLFYSWIMNDIRLNEITFNHQKHEKLKPIIHSKIINCYLLARRSHPLIDDQIFKMMNLNNMQIKYFNSTINNEGKFKILNN